MLLQGLEFGKLEENPRRLILKDFKGRRYVENQQPWSKSDSETKIFSDLSRGWKGNNREICTAFYGHMCTVRCKQQLSCLQGVFVRMYIHLLPQKETNKLYPYFSFYLHI